MTWYNIQIGSQTVFLVVKCQLNLKLKKYYKRVSYRPQSPTSNSNECLCVRLQIDQMSFKIEKLKKYYKRVSFIYPKSDFKCQLNLKSLRNITNESAIDAKVRLQMATSVCVSDIIQIDQMSIKIERSRNITNVSQL